MASQEEYVQRLAEAGLLEEYQEIVALVQRGMAMEEPDPQGAVPIYRQAYDRVEAAGAVAGATGHPLFPTRNSIMQLVGELASRGYEV